MYFEGINPKPKLFKNGFFTIGKYLFDKDRNLINVNSKDSIKSSTFKKIADDLKDKRIISIFLFYFFIITYMMKCHQKPKYWSYYNK